MVDRHLAADTVPAGWFLSRWGTLPEGGDVTVVVAIAPIFGFPWASMCARVDNVVMSGIWCRSSYTRCVLQQ